MPQLVPTVVAATLITLAVAGGAALYVNLAKPPHAPPSTVAVTQSALPRITDPSGHSAYDADLAKKFVLYHELAAQLDSYAIEHATLAEVREFAAQQHTYNTTQVDTYIAMLNSWNETFFRLDDFPKVAGSSCGTYPTFPGMLPHAKVNTYLQSGPQNVDEQYLQLTAQHHSDITTTISANEAFAANGEFTEFRKEFMITRDSELAQIKRLQAQFKYI